MTATDTSTSSRVAPAGERLLEVRDLEVRFNTDAGVVRAVNGLTFEVRAGETLAVVGESGSGKSVTGLSLLGLLPAPEAETTGQIVWRGEDLLTAPASRVRAVRGAEISMIFQDAMTALNPVFTIGHQISEMIRLHLGLKGKAADKRGIEMLDAVGIPKARDRYHMYPHEFSGGMRQRAMIAMAISCDPQLIIADEPTTALDVTVQAQVLELLAEIQERTGAGMILITHDLGVVAGVADRVMVMYAGRQVESSTTDDVFYDTRHPYSVGLMASLPRVDTDATLTAVGEGSNRLKPIEGQPPSLLHLPSGCAFHPRCELASLPDPCSTDVPPLVAIGDGEHRSACHFAQDLVGRAREVGSDYATVVEIEAAGGLAAQTVSVPASHPGHTDPVGAADGSVATAPEPPPGPAGGTDQAGDRTVAEEGRP